MSKKRVIIIHGFEGSPQGNWFPWLKSELEKIDCEVLIPAMPNAYHPKMSEWIDLIKETVDSPNEDIYFVGHSLGVIAILRYLESLEDGEVVGGVILVAGFSESIGNEELKSFFESPLQYQKIKKSVGRFVVIHSDNDPAVPFRNAELLCDKFGAELVVIKGGGHMNAKAGYYELPIVLEKLEELMIDIE